MAPHPRGGRGYHTCVATVYVAAHQQGQAVCAAVLQGLPHHRAEGELHHGTRIRGGPRAALAARAAAVSRARFSSWRAGSRICGWAGWGGGRRRCRIAGPSALVLPLERLRAAGSAVSLCVFRIATSVPRLTRPAVSKRDFGVRSLLHQLAPHTISVQSRNCPACVALLGSWHVAYAN